MNNTRRQFLTRMGFACAALAAARVNAGAVAGKKKIPVGLQLYSLRKQGEADFAGMIKKVGEIGYSGVEFAGYGPYGDKAAELRKLLDDAGLKAYGSHTGYDQVMPDKVQKTIDFHKALGCAYIVVPWIDPKQMESKDGCAKVAEILTKANETVVAAGLRLGYHAHGGDFAKIDGDRTAWEVFFDLMPKTFVHQMDFGNCMGGGGDPYKLVERYPGQSLTVHLKEFGGPEGAVFGQGKVDFKRALALCENVGGTGYYIVEHESNPDKAYDSVKQCLDYLKTL